MKEIYRANKIYVKTTLKGAQVIYDNNLVTVFGDCEEVVSYLIETCCVRIRESDLWEDEHSFFYKGALFVQCNVIHIDDSEHGAYICEILEENGMLYQKLKKSSKIMSADKGGN